MITQSAPLCLCFTEAKDEEPITSTMQLVFTPPATDGKRRVYWVCFSCRRYVIPPAMPCGLLSLDEERAIADAYDFDSPSQRWNADVEKSQPIREWESKDFADRGDKAMEETRVRNASEFLAAMEGAPVPTVDDIQAPTEEKLAWATRAANRAIEVEFVRARADLRLAFNRYAKAVGSERYAAEDLVMLAKQRLEKAKKTLFEDWLPAEKVEPEPANKAVFEMHEQARAELERLADEKQHKNEKPSDAPTISAEFAAIVESIVESLTKIVVGEAIRARVVKN